MEKEKIKNAFTILEMLIVLIIVSIITTTMVVNVNNFNQKNTLNSIAKQLGSDYNMIQSESINRVCNSHIEVGTKEYKIYICDSYLKTKKLPGNIEASTKFTSNISVNKNGKLRFGAGRVIFKSRDFEKQIIFSIGEGRYKIE